MLLVLRNIQVRRKALNTELGFAESPNYLTFIGAIPA